MSKTPDTTSPKVTAALNKALLELENYPAHSKEYAEIVKQIVELHKLHAHKRDYLVSPDTLVTVGANLLGIVAILSFEQTRVIATKALGFVAKVKI
jgi:hypothetical protein